MNEQRSSGTLGSAGKLRLFLFGLFIAAVLCCGGLSSADTVKPLGDVNLNGRVDASDSSFILRSLVGLQSLSAEALTLADVDSSSSVTARDASYIMRYLVGLDTLPPSDYYVTSAPTNTPSPVPTATPKPTGPLADKVVFLDPGHGINPYTGNCYGHYSAENYCESATTLAIATYCKAELESLGATVVMTRANADMVGNMQRMTIVNNYAIGLLLGNTSDSDTQTFLYHMQSVMNLIYDEYDAYKNTAGSTAGTYFNTPYDETTVANEETARLFDMERSSLLDNCVFISIHTNAPAQNDDGTYSTSINGIRVYCNQNKRYAKYYSNYRAEQNLRLANALLNTVYQYVDISNSQASPKDQDYFMMREHNIAAALIEVGFHTNAHDRAVLQSEEGQRGAAKGIAQAIVVYFSDEVLNMISMNMEPDS